MCSGRILPLLEYMTLPLFRQNVFSEEEEGGSGPAEMLEVLQKSPKGLRFHYLL